MKQLSLTKENKSMTEYYYTIYTVLLLKKNDITQKIIPHDVLDLKAIDFFLL